MTPVSQTTNDDARTPPSVASDVNPRESPLKIVVPAAAAMAIGMGVGRFVYTPILPLMHAQVGLSPQLGAHLATANYAGYLAGAIAGIIAPALVRSRSALRLSLTVVVATLATMPLFSTGSAWIVLRFVAGAASAPIFMIAATALLAGLRAHGQQLIGWGFGGVGIGIAASGALVLALHTVDSWRLAWWSAAALSILLTAFAWPLRAPTSTSTFASNTGSTAAPACRWFASLLAAYTLEGVGYIVAGTFLVAAIDQNAPANVGNSAWILVGAAALPSSALWAGLSRTWSRPTLLAAALIAQGVGVALPAVFSDSIAALASAILFGATFLGIGTIAMAIGTHLRTRNAVAILTTGYSAGQILGPILVSPLLDHGYQHALLVSTAIIAVAAFVALTLRHRFPHHLGPLPTRVRSVTGHTDRHVVEPPLPMRDPMTSANAGPSGYPWIRGAVMEFLVDMVTTVPDGTTSADIEAIRAREATQSRELVTQGHLLRLWRPPLAPGEWRTLGLFQAADAEELEHVLASMPLRVWRHDTVTALTPHPNDPAGTPPHRPLVVRTGEL